MNIDRRAFVMTSLIGGLSLAAPRGEAAAIHTDTQGLQAGTAQIPVGDGELPGYWARPEGAGRFPIVLVTEEIFGVHEYIRDVCRRLAKLGYMAVAPEYYARIAELSTMSDPQRIITEVISRAPDAKMMDDMDQAVAWAGQNGGDTGKVGMVGFCRGGRQTWLYAAHDKALKAAVAFYGPLGGQRSEIQPKTALDLAGSIHCPLLALYGGKDDHISAPEREAAQKAADAAGRTVKMVVFPEAEHGFHADYRPSYDAQAATEGWRMAMAWFADHGLAPAKG